MIEARVIDSRSSIRDAEHAAADTGLNKRD
jgi:hypothetical protein